MVANISGLITFHSMSSLAYIEDMEKVDIYGLYLHSRTSLPPKNCKYLVAASSFSVVMEIAMQSGKGSFNILYYFSSNLWRYMQ
jgi:hypothetical protein